MHLRSEGNIPTFLPRWPELCAYQLFLHADDGIHNRSLHVNFGDARLALSLQESTL